MRLIIALSLVMMLAGLARSATTACDWQQITLSGEPYRCHVCCHILHVRWDGVLDRFRCGMRCRLDPAPAPEATPNAPETER